MRAHQDHIGLGIIVGPGAAIGEVAAAEEVERGKAIDMDRLSKEVHIVDEIARIAQNELVLALPWRAIIARAELAELKRDIVGALVRQQEVAKAIASTDGP